MRSAIVGSDYILAEADFKDSFEARETSHLSLKEKKKIPFEKIKENSLPHVSSRIHEI